MNTNHREKYGRHFHDGSRPGLRTFSCAHCPTTVQEKARGNALVQVARMRGAMMTHLREKHPDKLAAPPVAP